MVVEAGLERIFLEKSEVRIECRLNFLRSFLKLFFKSMMKMNSHILDHSLLLQVLDHFIDIGKTR